MGRARGAPNKLDIPETAAAAFESLLDGLGVDERAFTEGFGAERAQVVLNTSGPERSALDDAASVVLGTPGAAAGGRLARAIVRSWLIQPWAHPAELTEHNFSNSLDQIRASAEWPKGLSEPAPVFATLIGRLDAGDLLEVALGLAAQLTPADRATLAKALTTLK